MNGPLIIKQDICGRKLHKNLFYTSYIHSLCSLIASVYQNSVNQGDQSFPLHKFNHQTKDAKYRTERSYSRRCNSCRLHRRLRCYLCLQPFQKDDDTSVGRTISNVSRFSFPISIDRLVTISYTDPG